MKKIFGIIPIIMIIFACGFSYAFSALEAPEGYIWQGPNGQKWENGRLTGFDVQGDGAQTTVTVYCDPSSAQCCWEITNGGKTLELGFSVKPPHPNAPGNPVSEIHLEPIE